MTTEVHKIQWSLWVPLFVIALYGLSAILTMGGWIATDFNLTNSAIANSSPSSTHILGTDFLGRDVLLRALKAIEVAFTIGLFAASLATLIGLTLGILAGYAGGWTDRLVVWLYSSIESIPFILLISALAFTFGHGLINLFLVLGLSSWIQLCRVVRAEVIQLKNQEFMSAAQAMGLPKSSILYRHIFPNVMHLGLIQFSLIFVLAIKVEVIVSYLGFGVEPGTPSWGTMISDAQVEIPQGIWWNLLTATTLMFVLILAVNLFTDALRTRLDPKSKLE